ncbi:MAG: GGDEF domain-containing protein [Myxococcaceae bacterium]
MSEVAPQVDLLTGAYKRHRFEDEVARAVARAKKGKRPLCLLHVDIDDLQEHNDVHGRDALDQAVSWLASKISEVMDGRGPIGRLGGDELAVLMPGVAIKEAMEIAEAIRKLVPKTLHASAFGDYRLTVSMGVVAMRPEELSGNLLDAAEDACRKAKQGGRNAVCGR